MIKCTGERGIISAGVGFKKMRPICIINNHRNVRHSVLYSLYHPGYELRGRINKFQLHSRAEKNSCFEPCVIITPRWNLIACFYVIIPVINRPNYNGTVHKCPLKGLKWTMNDSYGYPNSFLTRIIDF